MTPENPHRASDVAEAVHEGEPVNPTSARAGRPNPRILVILVVSTIAAALLLLGLWALTNNAFVAKSDESGAPREVSAFQGDAQTPPAADAPTDATGNAQPVPTGEAPNVNAPTVPSNTVEQPR